MLLKDYLSSKKQNRRILVVSDLGRGQNLIRKYEAMTGDLVRNVTCMTISQLTDLVDIYIRSESGYTRQSTVIDRIEAMMLFRSIIFKNIESLKYFKNEKMMDFVTTKEIFQKANLVRSNGWSGDEPENGNDRVSDLKLLISEYEQKLEEDKLSDSISLLKTVIAEMKNWTSPESELNNIFTAEISYLKEDMDELSGIQKEFLLLLQNGQDHVVELYQSRPSIDMLDNCSGKASFFRGYGSFNEANFVANDILEKKIPFGSVTVLYTAQTKLPAITAALQGNGLNANIISDYPARNNAYINLARRIIAWANDDFSETALEKVLSSSVICVEAYDEKENDLSDSEISVEADEKKNVLAGQAYLDYVLKTDRDNKIILGWGYNRNLDFHKYKTEHASTDKDIALAKMHGELIEIFGNNGKAYDDQNKVRPIEVYKKLVEFIENNTYRSAEYAIGIDGIRRLKGAINLEDKSLTLNEVLLFVDELLASISQKDSVDANAISVQCISDWILLDRPNVYVIGLSLKDMQGNTTESPVLSDDEMEKYLGEGFKPTIRAKADLKETNLYRTLNSFTGDNIVFGFSSYDTVGFYENNPSSFFREALNRFAKLEVKDLPEFVYGNPVNGVEFDLPADMSDKTSYDLRLATSNSTMEVLLDCPKKYFYSKMMYIPENEYTEKDYSKWLDASQRGSFFHEIAEKYVTQMLVKPAADSYESAADRVLIESIAKTIMKKLLVQIPVAFEGLAKRETEALIEVSFAYFNRLHDSLNKSGWRVLFTEQKFEQATYEIEDYNKKTYEFEFNGIIDRIDYHADCSEKKILLRIIDYKTGKKESKEKENDFGKLLQYVVYKKALMETGHYFDENGTDKKLLDKVIAKIFELESIDDGDDWEIEFDSFNYVFPMENTDFEPIKIDTDEIEGINITRLKSILTVIQVKKTYPDHMELYNAVRELEMIFGKADGNLGDLRSRMGQTDIGGNVTVISKNETAHCRYCKYENLCEHRKAGDL